MRKMRFTLLSGQLFASSYRRVVIGGQGPYIEFRREDIVTDLQTTPGQEYRGKGQYSFCKYFWLCPVGHPEVKVYHQRGTVNYADYKVGYYYVSPSQLEWDGTDLYAEAGDKPGEARPTTLQK